MKVGEASRRDNEFDSCRKLPSKDEKSSSEFMIADDLRRVCCAERCRVDGARCKVLWYVVVTGRSVTVHGRSTSLSSGVEVSQAGVLDTRFLVETWKDSRRFVCSRRWVDRRRAEEPDQGRDRAWVKTKAGGAEVVMANATKWDAKRSATDGRTASSKGR